MAAHDENVVWHPHPVTVAQRDSTDIVGLCCGLPGCLAPVNPR